MTMLVDRPCYRCPHRSDPAPRLPKSDHIAPQPSTWSRPSITASDSVTVTCTSIADRDCSLWVQKILIHTREISTRMMYSSRWNRFLTWAAQHGLLPIQVSVLKVLHYLIALNTGQPVVQLCESPAYGDLSLSSNFTVMLGLFSAHSIKFSTGYYLLTRLSGNLRGTLIESSWGLWSICSNPSQNIPCTSSLYR